MTAGTDLKGLVDRLARARVKALDEALEAQVDADTARVIAASKWDSYKDVERRYRDAVKDYRASQ